MQNTSEIPKVFRPLLDWWVAAIVGLFIIVMLASIPLVLWSPDINRIVGIVSALVLLAMIIVVVDTVFYTLYVLDNEGLTVVSHLRHSVFPYRNMRALKPGGFVSLISFATHKRFALSRKNVIIKLANEHWKGISVSPKETDAFVNYILERIDQERSHRAGRRHHASVQS